ncbi:hypothetical protein IE53DRAFT_379098 [Violaceomyces palustris]|uniref:Uncharacterized protein n=1 Tax=Violaceomyces palustris TaxID=1673888 RepID=A0ACD0NZZ8_9BASI|nr:hypothetical protein IE53DRAFT_379098 [Violaceomyces palustris]
MVACAARASLIGRSALVPNRLYRSTTPFVGQSWFSCSPRVESEAESPLPVLSASATPLTSVDEQKPRSRQGQRRSDRGQQQQQQPHRPRQVQQGQSQDRRNRGGRESHQSSSPNRTTDSPNPPPRRNGSRPSVLQSGGGGRGSPTPVRSARVPTRAAPAPIPTTDWNSKLHLRAGFTKALSGLPKPNKVLDPQASASSNAKALPRLKEAVRALKLHVRPSDRTTLGPLHDPTHLSVSSASGMAANHATNDQETHLSANELKERRTRELDETLGGDYSRYLAGATLPKSLTESQPNKGEQGSTIQAVVDADKAASLNPDLSPATREFLVKTVGDKLGLGGHWAQKQAK